MRTGFTGLEISSRIPLPEQAPAARPYRGIDCDVVAFVGEGCGLSAFAVLAALPKAVHRAALRVGEDAGTGDDLGQLGVRQRDLDDVDSEQRGIRILFRLAARAIRQFFGLTHISGSGDIDVDVVLVLGIDQQGMRVRAAATLHGGDLLRIREIADIEDAYAAESVRTRGRRGTAHPCGLSIGGRGRGRRRVEAACSRPAAGMPCVPQSMRPLTASADMKSR